MKKRRNFPWWLLGLIWTLIIFLMASQTGEESHSLSYRLTVYFGNLFYPDFKAWNISRQADWISGIEELLRKIAHYFEFAILGTFVYLAAGKLLGGIRRKKPFGKAKCAFTTFYLCTLIATASELIQVFVENRNAGAADVALDCIGIVSGILFVLFRTKQQEEPAGMGSKTDVPHRKG